MDARLYVTRPMPYKLHKYKTYEDFLHSTNALASILEDPRGNMPLALSFRWSCMALPILTQAYQSSLCEDSVEELSSRCQNLFSCPSDPSIFLSHLGTCRLVIALSLSDFSKSFSLASLGHGRASAVVRRLWCLISSGSSASASNNNWNMVKLVALQTVVLWLHTALGMTSAHFPFFSPLSILLIA
jgi:hypothetical protein